MVSFLKLLDKLRMAKIYMEDGIQKITQPVFDAGKGHLIHIMPELIDCIVTKEIDLRSKIKEILYDVSCLVVNGTK